ncbi:MULTISPECIES: hypothetical protein [unclassified Moorena]|nr:MULTISPECIES: hypothetical protein [unclassified Moorena]
MRIFDLKFPTPYSLLPVPFAIDNQGRPESARRSIHQFTINYPTL